MPLQSAGNPIGKPFLELQSVDSTNKYAMGFVHDYHMTEGQYEPQHGMAIFAHEQTAGKGQRGKSWASEKGANIALSILLNPYPLKVSDQFKLSVCVSTSVHKFFSKYAGDETSIKWPNDLYWRDRKAGGILIENQIRGQHWQWAVVGIGININQTTFDPTLTNPVSLKQITGKTFDPVQLAKELCTYLTQRVHQLINHPFSALLEEYNRCLFKRNEVVQLKRLNTRFTCTILGVNEVGELLVKDGPADRFVFGEVSWGWETEK